MSSATNSILLIIQQYFKSKDIRITPEGLNLLEAFAAAQFRQLLRPLADPEHPRLSFLHSGAIQTQGHDFQLSEARISVGPPPPV